MTHSLLRDARWYPKLHIEQGLVRRNRRTWYDHSTVVTVLQRLEANEHKRWQMAPAPGFLTCFRTGMASSSCKQTRLASLNDEHKRSIRTIYHDGATPQHRWVQVCCTRRSDALRQPFKQKCDELGLKGTILLSHEGINIFVAGPEPNIEQFRLFLSEDERFSDIDFKVSIQNTNRSIA